MVWFDVPQLPVPHQSGVLSHAPCACALLPAALCDVPNLAVQCPGPVYLPSFLDHPSPNFFFFSSFIALEAHRTLPYRFSVRNPQIPLKVLLLPYRIAVFFRPLLSTPYLNPSIPNKYVLLLLSDLGFLKMTCMSLSLLIFSCFLNATVCRWCDRCYHRCCDRTSLRQKKCLAAAALRSWFSENDMHVTFSIFSLLMFLVAV